ncbi:MAG: hypothetical protein C0483_05605 [Pirellula sp.]|nr:hypothetical protein [Pirellula sp.]
MHEHEPLTPDLQALEARLAGLAPTAGIDRDKLMYEAGRAATAGSQAAGRRAAWPLATLLAAASALVVGRWTAPQASIDAPLVAVIESSTQSPAEVFTNERLAAPDSYAQLRRQLGPGALAQADRAARSESPRSSHSRNALLQELLN